MPNFKPVHAGERFGKLTFVEYTERRSKAGSHYGLFSCDCGRVKEILIQNVRSGKSTACGCVRAAQLRERNAGPNAPRHPVKHGGSKTLEYEIFKSAKRRCTSRRDKSWPNYGGRGIKFLFGSFEEFSAELGPRPSRQYSIDRIDNDGNYEKGNVAWATASEQAKNRRPKRWQKRPAANAVPI